MLIYITLTDYLDCNVISTCVGLRNEIADALGVEENELTLEVLDRVYTGRKRVIRAGSLILLFEKREFRSGHTYQFSTASGGTFF